MYIFCKFYYFIKKNYLILFSLYLLLNLFFQIYIIYFLDITFSHSPDFILHVNENDFCKVCNTKMEIIKVWDTNKYNGYFPWAIDWNSKSIDYIDFNKITVDQLKFYSEKYINCNFSTRYPLRNYLGLHFFWARSDLDITAQEYCNKWDTNINFSTVETSWFKSSMRTITDHHKGDLEKALPDAIKTIMSNNKKVVFYDGIKSKYSHYK